MYETTAEREEDDELMAKARLCLLQGYLMRKRLTGDESPETAESLNNLGMHLLFNGNSPEEMERGLQTLRTSLAVAERVYGVNHPETAMAHAVLALALFMHDDRDEALNEVRIAIPVTSRTLGDFHPDRAFEMMTLGHIYEERRRFDDAENSFLEALAIEEHVYGKTHPNLVSNLQALKVLYDAKGDAAKAVETQRRIEKLSGKDI
jgi:tetratricopeptide (TPR) repeat protein